MLVDRHLFTLLVVRLAMAGVLVLCWGAIWCATAEPALVAKQDNGIAIGGYDPVSFRQDDGPKQGTQEHVLMWHGATWLFASAQNMAKFEANPRAFEPNFGGYCAFGVSMGVLILADPQAWLISDGELYLFKNRQFAKNWIEDVDNRIELANEQWPQILLK